VASVAYDERAIDDLARLAQFLSREDPEASVATIQLIVEAIAILEAHPLIGKRAVGELRELVIARGRSGYLALYEYQPARDRVFIRAIRHQREAGFEE